MYHEERIVDGVLCWRGAPKGEWTPYTQQELTVMLNEVRQTIFQIKSALGE